RQCPGRGDLPEQVLQHRQTGGPVFLEEGHLRFDSGDEVAERRHRAPRELGDPGGADTEPPGLEQRRMRVDSHTEVAPLRHGGPETDAERAPGGGVGHRAANPECSCCSGLTETSPRRIASIPWTAAVAPCTVVTHGTRREIAEDRIS